MFVKSCAYCKMEITILELTVNQASNREPKVDFVVDSLKNFTKDIFSYPMLWIQLNGESGYEKFIEYLKQSLPKLKAIKLNKDLDSTFNISKLSYILEDNEYRVIRFFNIKLPGLSNYTSSLNNEISHLGTASYTYINNCSSNYGEEMIETSMERKFDFEYDDERDTIYTIGHKLNLKLDSICELFYITISNGRCDQISFQEDKNERYVYWLTDSLELSSNNSELRELVIEKPIWDINLFIDNSIKHSLESFKLKTAYTGSFPSAIYGCKNIKKLSVNMFGFRDDLLHLDSFPNLEYLELFNCLELTDIQLKDILNSKILKNLKQITITYPPNTKFLEKILKKCKALESFETDLYSLAVLSNYTQFDSTSNPSINKKWIKLLKPLKRISNTSGNLFFFDSISIYFYGQDMDNYYGTPYYFNSFIGVHLSDDSMFKQISLDLYNSSDYLGCVCFGNKEKTQTNNPMKEIAEKEKVLIEYFQKVFKNFTFIYK